MVEDLLGKHGMVCLEDVINELHSAGPHFRETNQARNNLTVLYVKN